MTVSAVVGETIARLEAARGLNAALDWSADALSAEAAHVAEVGRGGPLGGMPVAIKDNIVTGTLTTSCASRMLEGYRSPYPATAVERLRRAGGLVACSANMDEFAMGSSTEHSAFGRVLHPLDPSLVPGGSSGGSAALVAAGVVPAALGSETGGSVRQPAAFCGIVGVKPTYGRVSRFGLVAFGSSLDCIAVFGRDVATAGAVLAAISGADRRDATTIAEPPLALEPARTSLVGVTFGLPDEYLPDDLDPGVRAGVDRAIAAVTGLGGTIKRVSLPHAALAVPTYYVIAPAEAAANLARYDGVRFGARKVGAGGDLPALYRATRGQGFGPEVRRRILMGTYVLSSGYYDAFYGRAQAARALIAEDFRAAFVGVDALLTPTTPTPAFRAGAKIDDPVQMYRADVFVCSANLAGVPAMSLPAGRSEGRPIGVQLISPWRDEARMLAIAAALEGHLDPIGELR